jgi:hypothetical protein
MVVVRNDNSRRLVLQGGFIGVRITTERVSCRRIEIIFDVMQRLD